MTLSDSREKPKKKGKTHKETELTKEQSLVSLQLLQSENEALKQELLRYRRLPSSKIGFTLFITGTLVLVASFVATSAALAFIGLGLTFWGALFLFAKPVKFVRSTLLDSTVLSSYTTLDRIVDDLNYKGKPMYIPPYPQEGYLPEYLRGLKEMVVLISARAHYFARGRAHQSFIRRSKRVDVWRDRKGRFMSVPTKTTIMPSIEEMAEKQFLLKNPKGICIAPPGLALASFFEKELGIDFTKIDLDSLYNGLSTIIVNDLELAGDFEVDAEKELFHVKITDSAYKNLYSIKYKLKSVHSIGCPLTSAVACATSKTTGKIVTITKSLVSPDLRTIEIWYQTLEV